MTYKEEYIQGLTRRILALDKENKFVEANRLREIRKKAKSLHGKHFVPTRFPSAKLISLKLAYYG